MPKRRRPRFRRAEGMMRYKAYRDAIAEKEYHRKRAEKSEARLKGAERELATEIDEHWRTHRVYRTWEPKRSRVIRYLFCLVCGVWLGCVVNWLPVADAMRGLILGAFVFIVGAGALLSQWAKSENDKINRGDNANQ